MSGPSGAFAVESPESAQAALTLLDGVYALMRTIASVGPGHPELLSSAQDIADAVRLPTLPCAIQFLGVSAYCNRVLLPVDIERVAQTVAIARALDHLGAQELVFDAVPSASTLMSLAFVLAQHSNPEAIAHVHIDGVTWRPLVGPVWGDGGKPVDRDVAARVWLARAVRLAEQIDHHDDQAWPWERSAAVVRRLDQLLQLEPHVASRALELTIQPWSPGRRAVAVALRTLLALDAVGVQTDVKRTSSHVALILAHHAFTANQVRGFESAAQRAMTRLIVEPGVDLVVSARHRLRVIALMDALARRAGTGSAWPGPLGAILLSLAVETVRGGGMDRGPTIGIMEALAACDADGYLPGGRGWFRALVAAYAGFPPSAVVMDAKNQLGVVLDSNAPKSGWQVTMMTATQLSQAKLPLVPLLKSE